MYLKKYRSIEKPFLLIIQDEYLRKNTLEQRKPIRYLIILLQDQVINKTEINQHQNKLYLFCLIEQGRLRSESSS